MLWGGGGAVPWRDSLTLLSTSQPFGAEGSDKESGGISHQAQGAAHRGGEAITRC